MDEYRVKIRLAVSAADENDVKKMTSNMIVAISTMLPPNASIMNVDVKRMESHAS